MIKSTLSASFVQKILGAVAIASFAFVTVGCAAPDVAHEGQKSSHSKYKKCLGNGICDDYGNPEGPGPQECQGDKCLPNASPEDGNVIQASAEGSGNSNDDDTYSDIGQGTMADNTSNGGDDNVGNDDFGNDDFGNDDYGNGDYGDGDYGDGDYGDGDFGDGGYDDGGDGGGDYGDF